MSGKLARCGVLCGLQFTLWVGRPREKGLRWVKEGLVNVFSLSFTSDASFLWPGRAELLLQTSIGEYLTANVYL